MESRDTSSPDGQNGIDCITAQDLERIANPLTVVHGYTELLQRRIRRGQTIDDEELLRILGLIEASSRLITVGLTVLIVRARTHNRGRAPE